MNTYQRLVKGEKLPGIPTTTWNAMVSAIEWVERNRLRLGTERFTPESSGVNVKNNSSDDIDAGGVLGLGAPLITVSDNLSAFKEAASFVGASPTSPDHVGNFGICLEPIPAGKIGKCAISGIAICKIQVDSSSHQQYADIRHGRTDKLIARYSGAAEILWKESGTGDKWAIVNLGPLVQQAYQGKLTGGLTSTAAATLDVWTHSTAGAWSTAGYSVTAYSPLMLGSGKTIPSGASVLARGDRVSGLLVVEGSGDCPTG
jgi:hypothetical protein